VSEPETLSFVVVGTEQLRIPAELPILPVRDAVVFPGMNVPLSVGRARSLAALEEAGDGGFLVVATQKSPETEEPTLSDLHPIACIARIVRVVDARGQARQALVLGLARTRLSETSAGAKGALRGRIEALDEASAAGAEAELARSRVVELAHRVIDLRDDYPDEWKNLVSQIPTPGLLADLIASNVGLASEERIGLLCEPDPMKRLWRIASSLEREITIAETQRALRAEQDPED
jgi:ATP-dependent Lon protease